jgi:hypothetical protein
MLDVTWLVCAGVGVCMLDVTLPASAARAEELPRRDADTDLLHVGCVDNL